MIKIEKYNGTKTYMYPNGSIATPEVIKKDFPAVDRFTHIIETDESGEVLFAIQNLAAIKSQMGLAKSLSDNEAIAKIEELRNTVPENFPSPTERIASALEFQNMLQTENV